MPSPIDLLLSATRTAVRYAVQSDASQCPETAILDDVMSQPFPRSADEVEPTHVPVVARYFDAAVQAAVTPRERMLAGALASASPHLRWIAPYRSEDGAHELAAGYAVAMLSMPGPPPREGYEAPLANPNVLVAFTLQAPRIFYPLHRHEASEIYHLISGVAEWQRDGEPWRQRQPGEWLLHASGQGHAMRTARVPLLAMVAWVDHLDCTPPVLEVDEPD